MYSNTVTFLGIKSYFTAKSDKINLAMKRKKSLQTSLFTHKIWQSFYFCLILVKSEPDWSN